MTPTEIAAIQHEQLVKWTMVLQQDGGATTVEGFIRETIGDVIAFLPRLLGALLILIIGWIIGAAIGKLVRRVTDSLNLDRYAQDTPLGRMGGDTRDPVAKFLGKVAAWFIYALAILAAADALAIPILSQWLSTAVSYLPAFIAGLLIIVGGFILADFIGDAISRTRTATESRYTSWFADGTKMFLYFTAIIVGLDTMGIDVTILYLFARALAWGLAAAIALAVGISFGWGAKDYVSQNMDRWAGRVQDGTSSTTSGDD